MRADEIVSEGLAAVLLAALVRGGTVVVDELDAKLHPKLLRYVILLYKEETIKKVYNAIPGSDVVVRRAGCIRISPR